KGPGATLYTKVQNYSSAATFHWVTTGLAAGIYHFSVLAQDDSSAGVFGNASARYDAFGSFNYTLTPGCASVGVSAAPPSPQMEGQTLTVTATAFGCPNPLYEFWLLAPGAKHYFRAQAYSTLATWSAVTGPPPGTYRFSVWVKDASSPGTFGNSSGRYDAFNASVTYTLTAGCPSVGVSFAPPSPHARGGTIVITSSATGCPSPKFEIWVKAPGATTYTKVQTYTAVATYNWVTTVGTATGTYSFSIWVEDASSTGTFGNASGRYDAFKLTTYTLTP